MDWVEVEADSEEAAGKKAVEIMGVDDIKLLEIEQVKVVRKFMGMGGRTCKLRVRIKPDTPDEYEPVEIREDVPSDKMEQTEEQTDVVNTTAPAPAPAMADEPAAPQVSVQQTGDEVVTFDSRYRPWITGGQGGVYIPKKGKGYAARLYNPEPLADIQSATGKKEAAPDRDREEPPEDFLPAVYEDAADSTVPEQAQEKALEFVNEIIHCMGITIEAKAYRLKDRLLVQIDSDSAGLLIGHRGETLEALQYLTDIVVNRTLEHRVRISIDSEHYREKRKFRICQMANEAAQDAVRTKKAVSLAPMNPGERRLVHTTLAKNSSVQTRSEGDGSRRRVVVHCMNKKGKGQKPDQKRLRR